MSIFLIKHKTNTHFSEVEVTYQPVLQLYQLFSKYINRNISGINHFTEIIDIRHAIQQVHKLKYVKGDELGTSKMYIKIE
jgi:hypothetical protein